MRAKIQTRHVPAGSVPVTRDGVDAIAYLFDVPGSGRVGAIGYSGKRAKPDFHYTFKAPEFRERYLAEWFDKLKRWAEIKAERSATKQAARAAGHPWKIGDVFHYSWGWEQTQCEFFQVVATTKGTITLRPIASETVEGSEAFMSDRRVAVRDAFLEDESIVKVVQYDRNGAPHISMEHGYCGPWDGKPEHCSWYA